jgi:hypothetical protein
MQIEIIGDNDTARATRTLLRQAGFAVAQVSQLVDAAHSGESRGGRTAPRTGYTITIEESDQSGWIHFDSVDCALEQLVLRHVTALSQHPVSIDRPGGRVHSDQQLRIIIPFDNPEQSSAVEFGVLRGLLELTHSPAIALQAAASPSWWRRIFA